nr:hypothetical protein [Tanacetum cinerariifolium]
MVDMFPLEVTLRVNKDGDAAFDGKQDNKTKKKDKGKSFVESFMGNRDLSVEFEDHSDNSKMEDITYSDHENVGAEADFNNLETSIIVSPILTTKTHKHHPVSQIIGYLSSTTQTRSMTRVIKDQGGFSQIFNDDFHTCMFACFLSQEEPKREGIDYEEVFALVARIEAIRLFLAYASFMGFMVYQMDVKSAFLYGTIEEEVYVCQPPGFKDLNHPDKVYKVVKALYGLHQAARAWYETLANYLLENADERQVPDEFNGGTHILFGSSGKSASTPTDTKKPLLKDPDGEDVDVHIYKSMIGSLMYLTSLRPDIMFASNDVTRLQALVDRKKVVITEATIRDVLRLDDADGVDCLPNEEIFAELARMGYEKPAKRTSWNEFSSAMASVVICLSTCRKFNFSKYTFESLVRNVDSRSKFYMYPRFIQLIIQNQLGDLSTHSTKYTSPALTQKVFANMRRVGKGFLGVETPLFKGMLVAGEPGEQGDVEEQVQDNVDDAAQGADTAVSGDDVQDQSIPSPTLPTPPPQQPRVEHLELNKVAQALEITKLKKRVQKLERANKVKVLKPRRLKKVGTSQRIKSSADTDIEDASNQGRMIADLDKDIGVALMDEVVAAISESVTAAGATIDAVPAAKIIAALSKDKGKGIMVEEPKPMKKKQQFKMDEEYARKLHEELNKDINWSVAIDHVKQKAKEDSYVQRYQLEEEENRAIERMKETPAQKAAKRRKLNEEVEYLK